MSAIRYAHVLLTILYIGGCHRGRPPEPEHTESRAIAVMVPPPVSEMSRVRAHMWLLAREVRLLALLTDAPDRAETDARAHLDNMQRIAEELAQLPERRNHPILDKNITGFIKDIERAKAEVSGGEPDWGMTRSITGACVRCHELRTCPFDSYQQCLNLPIY